MKQKTSITLSREVLQAIDQLTGPTSNRSRVIELAVVEFLTRRRRLERDQRDLELLDRAAEDLDEEMEDVLAFQVEP